MKKVLIRFCRKRSEQNCVPSGYYAPRDDMVPSSEGGCPRSVFDSRLRKDSRDKAPTEVGISPVRPLSERSKCLNLTRLPMLEGSLPPEKVSTRLRCVKLLKKVNSMGIFRGASPPAKPRAVG